jgi:hypothetical protein
MSEVVERDMDNQILFYNASSIACCILLETLSRKDDNDEKGYLATAPSLLSLHKRLIDKFNVGGY